MIHLMPIAVTYSKYENLLSIWNLPHLGVRLAELYPQLCVYFFFHLLPEFHMIREPGMPRSPRLGRLSSSDSQWYAQHVCPITSPTAS